MIVTIRDPPVIHRSMEWWQFIALALVLAIGVFVVFLARREKRE